MATATLTRAERLDARVTREEKEMIETAASLRGTSASDFVRMATREAALKTIREHEVLTLNEEEKRIFVEALLNPPKPNEAALAAARRWKEEVVHLSPPVDLHATLSDRSGKSSAARLKKGEIA